MNGIVIRRNFTKLVNNPALTSSIVTQIENECCFILPALAESGTLTSELKNDKHSVYWCFDSSYTSVELALQKENASGVYVDIDDLTTSIVGTPYELGFYTTLYNEQAIGYLIEWRKVLQEFGEGQYRIKCTSTLLTSEVQNRYSFEFCLLEYTEDRADETVYLEWYKNGNSGSLESDYKKVDYGSLNYYNAIRLPNAKFGFPNIELQKEYTKYQSGENIWIQDSLEQEYTLNIDLIPMWFGDFLIKDANVNTKMLCTDYNQRNHKSFVQIPISFTGVSANYEESNTLVSYQMKYKPLFNNFIHKRV